MTHVGRTAGSVNILTASALSQLAPAGASNCWQSVIIRSLTQNSAVTAPCGLRGCKNRSAPFPGWMSYKATILGSVCPLS